MKRLEFVMDESIVEDFFSHCQEEGVGTSYTRMDNVTGKGRQNPRLGDSVWPQLNTWIMIVCEETDVPVFRRIVSRIREDFPSEGLFFCCSDCEVF